MRSDSSPPSAAAPTAATPPAIAAAPKRPPTRPVACSTFLPAVFADLRAVPVVRFAARLVPMAARVTAAPASAAVSRTVSTGPAERCAAGRLAARGFAGAFVLAVPAAVLRGALVDVAAVPPVEDARAARRRGRATVRGWCPGSLGCRRPCLAPACLVRARNASGQNGFQFGTYRNGGSFQPVSVSGTGVR
ncbi:hypothetical protein AB5I41_25465 [Sphingomonas sp. MMS24-JH45]